MTPQEIHECALNLGLRLERRGDEILVFGRSCPPDLAVAIREHKAALLQRLGPADCPGWRSIPPSTLPLVNTTPAPTPHERELVIDYLLRQGCDRIGPLTAWLVRRECAYYDGPGSHWDCSLFAYAAARDAACWQLGRTEAGLLTFLGGLQTSTEQAKR
jgi:hypothetical protein